MSLNAISTDGLPGSDGSSGIRALTRGQNQATVALVYQRLDVYRPLDVDRPTGTTRGGKRGVPWNFPSLGALSPVILGEAHQECLL
jgi:hypothetical protein